MNGIESFWDLIPGFFGLYVFIAYLAALFCVVRDLFGDDALPGWAKALWIVFLVFVPVITVLVYVIARGRAMDVRAGASTLEDELEAGYYAGRVPQ